MFSESIISNYIQDLNRIESCKLLRDALYEGEYLLDFYYCKKKVMVLFLFENKDKTLTFLRY